MKLDPLLKDEAHGFVGFKFCSHLWPTHFLTYGLFTWLTLQAWQKLVRVEGFICRGMHISTIIPLCLRICKFLQKLVVKIMKLLVFYSLVYQLTTFDDAGIIRLGCDQLFPVYFVLQFFNRIPTM